MATTTQLRHPDASPQLLAPLEQPPVRYSLETSISGGFTTEVYEAPVPAAVLDEVQPLWQETFGADFAHERRVLAGECSQLTRDLLYVAHVDGALAATTVITMGREGGGAVVLGGVGEVATVPEFRGRGLAATLVSLGRDDFSRLGGELLGLGTVNPAAARVYRKAGFHRLGGCDAWYCNVRDSRTPEEYLVDSFRAARAAGPPRYVNGTGDAWPCHVAEGTAAERVSAMALVHWVGASDDLLLDHNLELFSPRMETITSAMGVYNRYEAMREVFGGTWVTAHAPDGTLVGLATCMPGAGGPGSGDDEECCWVDAHIHRSFLGDWGALLGGATGWASAKRRFTRVAVRVAAEDDAKRQRFARHGFRPAGPDAAGGRALSLPLAHSVGGEDRQVELVVLEMALATPGGGPRPPPTPGGPRL